MPRDQPRQEETGFFHVTEKEESAPSPQTDRPLQLHEKERELRLPLGRQEETSFLSK